MKKKFFLALARDCIFLVYYGLVWVAIMAAYAFAIRISDPMWLFLIPMIAGLYLLDRKGLIGIFHNKLPV